MESSKRRREKSRSKLSSTQEVLYQREFKKADRAAGYKTTGIC
ncbi:YfhE family protein [Ectobacillus ponti]|uniref:YfhE family protein n=1 Tax=Ectobacillus ponti TaxID=2961894 RepID=A0AA42BR58_9BACI|nr:YfhE family protein [Ectobacillus ponti]MCP8970990.1 YfhE family protein [Ectobacillus ponti]